MHFTVSAVDTIMPHAMIVMIVLLTKSTLGFEIGVPGRISFVVSMGILRFIYRLLPGSFRYLTAYLDLERRVDAPRRARWLGHVSSVLANRILALAMPPRNNILD